MNAKRQTIWLVSMLSLMVVLSAYYLFTEDSGKVDLTTASGVTSDTASPPVTIDMKDPAMAKVDSKDAGKVEVKPDPNAAVTGAGAKTDAKAADAKAADAKAADKAAGSRSAADKATSGQAAADKTTAAAGTKNDAKTDTKTAAKTDSQILDQMTSAALSGSDYFADAQMKREEDFANKRDELTAITLDSKKTVQEQEKAYNDLDALTTMTTKINNLETELSKNYPLAVVQPDGQKYKVSVQAQKLTSSEAVTIVDLAMQQLGVAQDKIVVQYMP